VPILGRPPLASAEKLQTPMIHRKGEMIHRKGEMTPTRIDYEYPHQIEIPIPFGGLGTGQHDMNEFCRSRGIQFATFGVGRLWHKPDREAVRYCFRVADDAEQFQAMYGGERVALPPAPPIWRRWHLWLRSKWRA
jgi:hypothetical protein